MKVKRLRFRSKQKFGSYTAWVDGDTGRLGSDFIAENLIEYFPDAKSVTLTFDSGEKFQWRIK